MTKVLEVHTPVHVESTPSALIAIGIEKGMDIQQLEKLMDMQERWEKNQARKAFFEALSKFQTIVPDLKKNRVAKVKTRDGGTFSYNYSDLANITSSIKTALSECGLSFRWEFKEEAGKMTATCLLSHRDGHTEITSMTAGMDNSGAKNDIQQKGSTQTYLQRYTLIGALGLSTADEDNDGKNLAPVKPQKTEEEILADWKKRIEAKKNRVELQQFYLANKKSIDASDKLKGLIKAHETKLKESETKQPVEMP